MELHRNAYFFEYQQNYQSCRSGMSVTGSHFGLSDDVQRDASPLRAPTFGKAPWPALNCGMTAMDSGNASERQDAGVVQTFEMWIEYLVLQNFLE